MTSREYWLKREAEQRRRNITDEEQYRRELQRIYKDTLDSVQRDIDSFYARYASKEGITLAEAKRRVTKLDMEAYERKAAKYVRERDFSGKANEEMRLYNLTMKVNRLEMLKSEIGLELVNGFGEMEEFMDSKLNDRVLAEQERLAGILGKTVKGGAKRAEALVNASFWNATFSERLWNHQDELKQEIAKQLQSGLIQGKGSRELARSLRKSFDVSQTAAETLMVTELRRVQTAAAQQSYERNGNEEYEFMTTNDRPCEVCRGLNGKVFKVKDMQPGVNAPPMHPRCHCCTAPHWDEDEYRKWLSEQSGENAVENGGGSGIIKSVGTMDFPVQIGGVNCTVRNEQFSFSDGTEKGKPPTSAIVYTTPDGTRFVFKKKYNKKHQTMTPEQAISRWYRVPEAIRKRGQKTIEFVDYYNPQDSYWRKTYKNFDHSYATGGTTITFYRYDYPHDMDYVERTYCHEIGHYIDSNLNSNGQSFSTCAEWSNAMREDEKTSGLKSVTYYGQNSPAEDFAESIAEYVKDARKFSRYFPDRAKLIKMILNT